MDFAGILPPGNTQHAKNDYIKNPVFIKVYPTSGINLTLPQKWYIQKHSIYQSF